MLVAVAGAAAAQPSVAEQEVVVTATGRPVEVDGVPQLVTVVSETDLRRQQSRTTPEALSEQVGVLVQETNLGGGSPFLRGQTGNRVLMLVDGIRLNNSTYRFGPNQYLNTVDPFAIERMEVVRGPASVLYGSDALGGVINVITKRRHAFDDPVGLDAAATTRLGSAAFEKTAHAEGSGNLGPLGFAGGLTYRDFDDLRSGSDRQDHTGYDEADGDLRLQYRPALGHELAFNFQHVEQRRVPRTGGFNGGNSFYFDPQRRDLFALEHRASALPWSFGTWHTTISLHDQLEVRRLVENAAQRRRREQDRVRTFGFTSNLTHEPARGLVLTSGVEVYHDDVASERVDTAIATGAKTKQRGAFPDGTDYDTLGVFAQAETEVGELLATLVPAGVELPLTTIVGGRYNRNSVDSRPLGFAPVDQSFDAWVGSGSLVYSPLTALSVVGSVSQGFRAPNLDDTVVLRSEPDLALIDTPNPDLRPERVLNYEGGFKFAHPRVGGQLMYFYSDYTDLIERTTSGTGFDDINGNGVQEPGEFTFAQRRNVGEANIQGVEAIADVAVADGVRLAMQFSWIRGQNQTDDEPARRMPPILGRAGVAFEPAGAPYWVEFFARVAGRQDRLAAGDRADPRICPGGAQGCEGTAGWYTLNLRAGWRPTARVEIDVALENLTDQTYRLHGSGIDAPGFNAVGTLTLRL